MPKVLSSISVSLVGLFVVVALVLGARTALARPVTMDCTNNGTTFLGSCADNADCQHKCDLVWGQGNSIGRCTDTPGCCHCLI